MRISAVFEKLLNVNKEEAPRISLSWFVSFFYRIGFVIGWTVIVGIFVGKFGIASLPVLFIVNAALSIIGSIVYSSLIERFSKEKIILWSVILSVAFLLLAASLGEANVYLFFLFLLIAEAVFLVQLKIVMNGFVETLFTPLESERTFPLIESAETVGGIIAGVLVVFFSSVISPSQFIYLWIVALLCILPCLLYHNHSLKGVYRFTKHDNDEHRIGLLDKTKEIFSQTKHLNFLKGLILVVAFQWIFANLIEFQYTKAVSENVSNAVLNSGSGFEHALVHGLGMLSILFSSFALVVQLFIGSRLITSLGIIGSMMIYPAVMILSVFGLTVKFGYPSAVMAQLNQNIAYVLYLNSYHSSYYPVREHYREHIREFLEGIVRPVAAIFGTGLLIGLQRFFTGNSLTLYVNLSMIFILVILIFVMYNLQVSYTKLACHNLLKSEDKIDRIDAIGILSQRGHKSSIDVLKTVLRNPKESDFIKVKILEAFSELQDFDAVDEIIDCLNSKKSDIRLAAVTALTKYPSIGKIFGKHIFYEYRIIEALKKMYEKERNEEIRSYIIHLLSKLNPIGTFGFLLSELKRAKHVLKAEIIVALGRYRDDHVIPYVKPFLSSRKPMENASAIVSLWHFPDYREDLEDNIDKMVTSSNPSHVAAVLFVIGELGLKRYQQYCERMMSHQNIKISVYASIALAKMGILSSVPKIVEFMLSGNASHMDEIRRFLNKLPHKSRKNIEKLLRQAVSERINLLLSKLHTKSLLKISNRHLKYLKMLYSLVDEHEEVELISELLYSKNYS